MNNEFVFVTRWVLTDRHGSLASNGERCPAYDTESQEWIADEGTTIERMKRSDPRNWVVISHANVAAYPYRDRDEEKKRIVGSILYGLVVDLSLSGNETTDSIRNCYEGLSKYLRNPGGCTRKMIKGSQNTYVTSCGSMQEGESYGEFCRICGDKVIHGD